MECCPLRVKDLEFACNQIVVRGGKGNQDRSTLLPAAVKEPLLKHLQGVKRQHEHDLRQGLGRVALPQALDCTTPQRARSGPGTGCFPPPVASTPTG